jgi:hypothetical protein
LQAAERAQACDPKVQRAAQRLRQQADEGQCRIAVRAMLARRPPNEPALRSVHAPAPSPSARDDATPLTPDELEALRSLEQPASVTLVPDVPPGPAVVRSRASLAGLELVADEEGRLSTTVAPGIHNLLLHHGGNSRTYCLELAACDSLTVIAHGSRLARHPKVTAGACPSDP